MNSEGSGKILLAFFSLFAIFYLLYNNKNESDKNVKILDEVPNFSIPLKNILSDEKVLKESASRQIFLIETHMDRERSLNNSRQACTVESAALTNPDMEIYFLFGTNSDGVDMKYSEIIEALLSYPNIHLRYINPKEFSKGTKLENFFQRGDLERSSYPIEHAADILRVLVLNKYGGQYLDLDLFSLVPLSTINRHNFACLESDNMLANGIMHLDTDEFGGKAISDKYLEFVDQEYRPDLWAVNGPAMITKSVQTFCNGTLLSSGKETKCGNFTALPKARCYPIYYSEWKKVFEDERKIEVLQKVRDSGSYFLHVWNKMQYFDKTTYKLKYDSKSAYMYMAKSHCPKIYRSIEKYF